MKFWVLFTTVIIANGFSSAFAQPPTQVTVVGDRNYAPYSYVQGDTAKGLYVDILTSAFKKLDSYQVIIEMIPWKRGLLKLESGSEFAIFPPYYSQQRPYLNYYSVPIYQEIVIPICRAEILKIARPNWPADYSGLTVGSNRGFLTPGPAFFKMVERQEISLIETADSEIALRMLLLKRIDCYVNSKLTITWVLNKLRSQKAYKNLDQRLVFGEIISKNNAYIGYSSLNKKRFPFVKDFHYQVDLILKKMQKNGEIAAILKKFIHDN